MIRYPEEIKSAMWERMVKMSRRKLKDRRYGPDRRGYEYARHIPERRSGNARRIYWANRRSGVGDRRINAFYPHTPERRVGQEG
jgi:hypothetical protein